MATVKKGNEENMQWKLNPLLRKNKTGDVISNISTLGEPLIKKIRRSEPVV